MKLAEARAAQGLTMTYLAEKAGVSLTSIHRIEKGKSSTSPERASWIADALGTVVDDIEELKTAMMRDGNAGDPCDCGCGGVKEPLSTPTSMKRDIKLPCRNCGTDRFYKPYEVHRPHCLRCHSALFKALPVDSLPKEQEGPLAEAARLIDDALVRKGLTLPEACRRYGLTTHPVHGLLRGESIPYHRSLKKLTDGLEIPEVLAIIKVRVTHVDLICPVCGRQRPSLRGNALQLKSFEGFDPVTAMGPALCLYCSSRKNGQQAVADIESGSEKRFTIKGVKIAPKRVRGKKAVRAYMKIVGDHSRAKLTPEQKSEQRRQARASRKPGPYSEEGHRNFEMHRIPLRPKTKPAICLLCPYIVLVGSVHKECWNSWLSDNKHDMGGNILPPRPEGYLAAKEELADSFEMFVRHYLRDLSHTRIVDGDRTTDYMTLDQLAANFHMSSRTVQRRMDRLIDQFPTDGRGGKQLARWSKIFRRAAGSRLKVGDIVTVPSLADPNRVCVISGAEWFDVAGYWHYRIRGVDNWWKVSEQSKPQPRRLLKLEEEEAAPTAIRQSDGEIWADLVNSLDRNVPRREQLLWLLSKGPRRLYELAEAMGIDPQKAYKPLNYGLAKDFVPLSPGERNGEWDVVRPEN